LTPAEHKGKTPAQFCRDWGISRRCFDKWKVKGVGPRVFQPGGPGGWQVILPEDEQAWLKGRPGNAITTAAGNAITTAAA
jgi:hypothetical protein